MPTQGCPPPSDASLFLTSLFPPPPPPPPRACSLLSRTPSKPQGHPGGFQSNHGLLPAPAHPPPPSSGQPRRPVRPPVGTAGSTPSHNSQVVGCKRHEKQSLAPPVIGVNPLEDGGLGGERGFCHLLLQKWVSLLLRIQVAFKLRLIFSLQRLRSYLVPMSPKSGILQRC